MEIYNPPQKMIGSYCFVAKCDTEQQACHLRVAATADPDAPYLGGDGLDIVCDIRNYDRATEFITGWLAKYSD